MKLDWKTCFKIGFSAFLFYLCVRYWQNAADIISAAFSAASPLLIGCIIAYLGNILMSFYEKHYFPETANDLVIKSRRPVCLIAVFLTLIIVLFLLLNLIVPELISCIGVIFSDLPAAIESVIDSLARIHILPENITDALIEIDWQSKISQLIHLLTSGAGTVMTVVMSTVSSVFSGIVTALVAIIFSIYLLLGKDTLIRQMQQLMQRYLRPVWHAKLTYILSILNNCFKRYIVGQCVEAVILGTLCALGMLILRLPYATMVGTLIAFTALIPVAGAYIGGAVGALMVFSVSPMKAVFFIIFLVILQQLEGNLIYPRVVGSSLGLPAIWVLAAVTIGGGIMGIAGMLIGVPIAAALYNMLREDLHKPHTLNASRDK